MITTVYKENSDFVNLNASNSDLILILPRLNRGMHGISHSTSAEIDDLYEKTYPYVKYEKICEKIDSLLDHPDDKILSEIFYHDISDKTRDNILAILKQLIIYESFVQQENFFNTVRDLIIHERDKDENSVTNIITKENNIGISNLREYDESHSSPVSPYAETTAIEIPRHVND